MQERFYIGVDGGGTHTRALLADQTGRVRGYGHAGSANLNHYPRAQVRDTLQAVLREALGCQPASPALATLFLGLGGVSTEDDRQDVTALLRGIPEAAPPARVVVDNDTTVGLTGGLAGRPGLTLIAGTGSACLGVNTRGERWLCGGWGALADDVGSAPWVGLRALQAAVRAEDGRGRPTLLRDAVFDFLRLSEPRQLVQRVHNQGLERAELGRLAPLVGDAWQQGDAVAESLLRDGAAGLAEMVQVTARRLFGDAGCELVLVGGLALSGPPFQPLLTEQIRQKCPQVTFRSAEFSPVQGAVLEALRADGVPWTPDLLDNLKAWKP